MTTISWYPTRTVKNGRITVDVVNAMHNIVLNSNIAGYDTAWKHCQLIFPSMRQHIFDCILSKEYRYCADSEGRLDVYEIDSPEPGIVTTWDRLLGYDYEAWLVGLSDWCLEKEGTDENDLADAILGSDD